MLENKSLVILLKESEDIQKAQKCYMQACDRRIHFLQDEVRQLTTDLGNRATRVATSPVPKNLVVKTVKKPSACAKGIVRNK